MTTTTSTHRQPDVHEMIVVHRVFRREFTMLPALVRGVREGDRRRANVVGGHLQLILAGLHQHHTGEDEVLWPRLLERAAPDRALVETMQAQHERVDAYVQQAESLLADWTAAASVVRGEQLARVVEDFAAALFEHLDLEERAILPLCLRHITVEEWNSLGEHGRDAMSLRQAPVIFGAVLEEADAAERAAMLAAFPAPVRFLLRTLGALQYRRYITRVRAA
jgi:hemerythrin-like domain-containing protein